MDTWFQFDFMTFQAFRNQLLLFYHPTHSVISLKLGQRIWIHSLTWVFFLARQSWRKILCPSSPSTGTYAVLHHSWWTLCQRKMWKNCEKSWHTSFASHQPQSRCIVTRRCDMSEKEQEGTFCLRSRHVWHSLVTLVKCLFLGHLTSSQQKLVFSVASDCKTASQWNFLLSHSNNAANILDTEIVNNSSHKKNFWIYCSFKWKFSFPIWKKCVCQNKN